MVIRKVFSATVGKDKMRFAASLKVMPASFSAGELTLVELTSRCILGGLPKSTSRGISIGLLSNWLSFRLRCCSAVASPTTANGARSRAQIASNTGIFSGATDKT